MNSDLDKKLCAAYPKIFVNRLKGPKETCMYWGIECGDGWYAILDSLCEALTYSYTTSVQLAPDTWADLNAPQVVFNQVKEKFGTLRVYFSLELDAEAEAVFKANPDHPGLNKWLSDYQQYFNGVVHMAEILSSKTCEMSGKPGVMHTTGSSPGGWCKVLNEEFAKTDPWCVSRDYKVPVQD